MTWWWRIVRARHRLQVVARRGDPYVVARARRYLTELEAGRWSTW
jgi:hypothetical protein